MSQEIMSETSLGRYNKKPTMRVQKAEVSYYGSNLLSKAEEQNASKALQFIRDRGVKLTNIGKSKDRGSMANVRPGRYRRRQLEINPGNGTFSHEPWTNNRSGLLFSASPSRLSARKVYLPKTVYCSGVSERRNHIPKSRSRISSGVLQMVLLCELLF